MGFPQWTLWGMGLSAAGALIAIVLSWLGQSPKLTRRLGLSGARLDLRVRTFTGYAMALLLLAIAFFLAGVPLGSPSERESVAEQDATPARDSDGSSVTASNEDATSGNDVATPATPETGAFSGPPASIPTSSIGSSPTVVIEPQGTRESPAIQGTSSISPTTGTLSTQPSATATIQPTETATPVPTATPFPTLTPTAIAGETAMVDTGGSTLWLKRSPGGQNVVLIRDGDIVLILSSRANQGGILWREVATVAGVKGWLQADFLAGSDAG